MAHAWCVCHGSGSYVHRCVCIDVKGLCATHTTAWCVLGVCATRTGVCIGRVHKHGAVPRAACRVPAVPVPCPHRRCRSPRPPRCGSLRARAHLRTRGDPPAHEPPPPSPSLQSSPLGPAATPEPPARISPGPGGAAPPAPSHPAAAPAPPPAGRGSWGQLERPRGQPGGP